MSKRILFVGALAILVTGISVAWLKAAPSVGPASAQPAYIVVNSATPITFTAQISDPSLIPASVNLLRTDASGKTLSTVGVMNDSGVDGDASAGDKVFSLRTSLTESQVGPVYYRVSAAFRRTLLRLQSELFTIYAITPDTSTQTVLSSAGGDMTDGATHVSIAPGLLTRDVLFTLNTPSRSALPDPVPLDATILGAVNLQGFPVDGDEDTPAGTDSYSALIRTPLFAELTPGTRLVLLAPNAVRSDWRTTTDTAVVDRSGWYAEFRTAETGLLLLVPAE